MSGEGGPLACPGRLVSEAIAAERQACIDHLRAKMAEVDAFRERGRITAEEASLLNRRLDAAAIEIEQGLHVLDGPPIQANRGGL